MKLITLTVSHLFGLKHNVKFDFTENNRICIVGENGSGKSSIMDSIRFALFGEASQSRAVNIKDYIRRGAFEGRAALEFEDKRGYRHRVTRRLRKNAKDAVSAEAKLETLTQRGWEEVASSVSAVNFAVSSLLLYGRIRDDVKDGDIIKQAKSSADIAAFISQGNISKILSVTPHERIALVSSALNIQDGELLKERVKELKKMAEYEKEILKTKIETYKNSLKAIPAIEELREAKRNIELDIELYSASLAILTEGAAILEKISDITNDLREHKAAKIRQETVLSSMRHNYSYGEYIRARQELLARAGEFSKAAAPVFANAPMLRSSKEKMTGLFNLKKDLYDKRTDMQAKYGSLQSMAELYPVLSEEESLKKRMSVTAGILSEKKTALENVRKDRDKLGEDIGRISAEIERTEAYTALQSAAEAEREIKALSATLLSHLVELLRTLGHGDIIDLNKLSLSGAEDFIERMNDSSFQAILFEIKGKKSFIEECTGITDAYKKKYGSAPEPADPAEKPRLEETLSALQAKAEITAEEERRLTEDISLAGKDIASIQALLADNGNRIRDIVAKNSLGRTPTLAEAASAAEEASAVRLEIASVDRRLSDCETEYTGLLTKVSRWESEETYFKNNKPGLINAIRTAAAAARSALESCMAATGARSMEEASREALLADRSALPTEDDMRQAESRYSALLQIISRDTDSLRKSCSAYEELRNKDDILLPSLRKEIEIRTLADHVARERDEKNGEITLKTREAGRLAQLIKQHETLAGQLEKTESQLEEMAPVFVCVKQLTALADANFSRYICDKTMEILLDGVNGHLSRIGIDWRLSSENGNLVVTDSLGERRPVSGMSGGEGTLISILLLKQIANFNCLWLDESLTMLDEGKLSEVTDILTGGDPDAQVIVISHDKDLARTFDTVWKMDSGEKVCEKAYEKDKKAVITAEDLRDGDYELI